MKQTNGRACEACRKRKVKCGKEQPECQKCTQLHLPCVYLTPVESRASRLGNERGKVIKACKNTDSASSTTVMKWNSLPVLTQKSRDILDYNGDFFELLIPDYLTIVYPVFPIITDADLRGAIKELNLYNEKAALVYSAFALVILNSTMPLSNCVDNRTIAVELVDKALDAKGYVRHATSANITVIMVSIFVSSCLATLNEIEVSNFYLREAITLSMMMRLENRENLETLNLQERTKRERLYWLMFIHERALAINFSKTCQLEPLDSLPANDSSLPDGNYRGFIQLIKLFSLIDENFVNAHLGRKTFVDQPWIEQKQKEVVRLEEELEYLNISSMMRVDQSITQQWVKIVLWKMSLARYRMSLSTDAGFMSLLFPVEISKRLYHILRNTSLKDITAHGSSFMQKLFELMVSISDVISLIPTEQLKESQKRIEYYVSITDFLLNHPQIRPVQKEILSEKVDKIKREYRTPASSAQNTPDGLALSPL